MYKLEGDAKLQMMLSFMEDDLLEYYTTVKEAGGTSARLEQIEADYDFLSDPVDSYTVH